MKKFILFLFAYFLISCAGSSKNEDKVALSEPYILKFPLFSNHIIVNSTQSADK